MNSSRKARVWNDSEKIWKEEFRGDMLEIPSFGFIEMPYPDAVQFRGQFHPLVRDGLGQDVNPKKIRLEVLDGSEPLHPQAARFICHRDGKSFPSEAALRHHIKTNYLGELIEEEAVKELSKPEPVEQESKKDDVADFKPNKKKK